VHEGGGCCGEKMWDSGLGHSPHTIQDVGGRGGCWWGARRGRKPDVLEMRGTGKGPSEVCGADAGLDKSPNSLKP
jgi:hypothetical protein